MISDLVTDQRVHRTALTLHEMGFEVLLVGRKLPDSLPVTDRPYSTRRFNLLFHKGALFYASYNIRLFFFLIFSKADLLFANDLDTLPANFYAARIKNTKLIYDSHEYFTGVPELVNRPGVQRIWKRFEKSILPRLKMMITVNDSIASMYREEYGLDVKVIRNVPIKNNAGDVSLSRSAYGLPENKKIFLFQGAGINVDRGAEEAVEAISKVPDAALLFIGGGDVMQEIKLLVQKNKLEDQVFFIPKQPMSKLKSFTQLADFGLSLDKSTNVNYRFSLPNKLFDYIQARLPVIVTALPEVERIVIAYNIGLVIPAALPDTLAEAMEAMIRSDKFAEWKENLNIAAAELCWDREKEVLISIVKNVVN